jgi:hypothetical protein
MEVLTQLFIFIMLAVFVGLPLVLEIVLGLLGF